MTNTAEHVLAFAPDLDRGRRYLAEWFPGTPLVMGVTGAHFYGFPSADSDLDLKGIHIAPTEDVVGLTPAPDTIDRMGTFEGQEMDCTSHEVAQALRLLLKGNGNMLERILTPYQLFDSKLREELVRLSRGTISKSFYRHYRGFCAQKQSDFLKDDVKTAKCLLYVYRSALTGIHLLATGDCVGDVAQLAPRYGFPRVADLIRLKRGAPEEAALADHDAYLGDWPLLEQRLTQAWTASPLPEAAPNQAEVSAWLVEVRRSNWARPSVPRTGTG